MSRLAMRPEYNDRLMQLYGEIRALTPSGWRVSCGPSPRGGMVAALFDARGTRTPYQGSGRTRELAVLDLRQGLGNGVRG